ncbi:MAG: HAMP domain-containing protein [Candidatus Aenigmatarchaeota archaeon]|nr:MAG: HAMP domain-containing protein [Candidatus Aenigmarchaeota archaeon]
MNLMTKAVIVFLLIGVLPVSVLTYVGISQMEKSYTESVGTTLELSLQSAVSGLIEYFQRILVETSTDSKDPVIAKELSGIEAGGSPATLNAHLSKTLTRPPVIPTLNATLKGIQAVVVTDANGRIVSSTHNSLIGGDVSQEFFFKQAAGSGAGTNANTTYFTGIVDHPLVLANAVKEDGRTIGVYAAVHDISDLANVMQGESSRELLVNSRGDLTAFDNFANLESISIYATTVTQTVSIAPSQNPDLVGRTIDIYPVNLCTAEGKSYKGEYVNYDGITVIGAVLCGAARTAFIAEIPKDEATQPLQSAKQLFQGMALIMGALITVALYAFRSHIIKPIGRLTETINSISMGRLDVEVEGKERKDEIGDLARAFERTVVSLKLAALGKNKEKEK